MARWLAIPIVAMTVLTSAAAEPLRIALIENSHDAETQRTEQGFRLGLDYAIKRNAAAGAIELTVLDDGGDPQVGSRLLAEAFREGRADLAINVDASAAAALPPVAADFKRVLLLARAPEQPITDRTSARYVFRTAHTASQLALACVLAFGAPELNLYAVAPDTRDGRAAVTALKDALERLPRGVFFVGSKSIRPDDADVGATVSSEFDDLHYLHGAKTLLMLWSGPRAPVESIAAANPGRFGIRLALCGDMDPNAHAALEGVTSYFPTLPRNAANDWLVEARERHGEAPDAATVDGMVAAIAVTDAIGAAQSADADALIATLEGLSFDTPKGRMTLRAEDHQALQAMYHFRMAPVSSPPELAREIGSSEIPLPIDRVP